MDVVREVLAILGEQAADKLTPAPEIASLPAARPHLSFFIDGSHAEMGKLTFVRTIAFAYKGNIQKKFKREFYVIGQQSIPAQDSSGREDAGLMRRLAELRLAEDIAKQHENALIVLDGSLDSPTVEEQNSLLRLEKTCISRNNTLAGISKTCSYTLQGKLVTNVVEHCCKTGYIPFGESFIVKLHEKATYAFRLDVKGDFMQALQALRYYANDPSFFGYPYPLIRADAQAKITQKEIQAKKSLLASRAGKDWSRIKGLLQDAHVIIDKINKNG
ncbi:MAG: DNA double-strand break repair nuclease NurA [archaeon]